MTELPVYLTGLILALGFAVVTALRHPACREPLLRTAAAILGCWIAGVAYTATTDDLTPWHFNIFLDAVTATVVMMNPAGRTQGTIGLLYFVQIAWHTAFGIQIFSGNKPDEQFYYDAITWVAWAQLAVLGIWCGGIEHDNRVRTLRNSRDASSSRPRVPTAKEKP